jgi:hypothetical protein
VGIERALPTRMIEPVDDSTRSTNDALLHSFMDETRGSLGHEPIRRIPRETDKFAVFVPSRPAERLEYVFRNVLHFLGPSWGLQIFAWPDLMREIQDFTGDWSYVHYAILEQPQVTEGALDHVMTQPDFWSVAKGRQLLVFDADTLLCDHVVDRFIDYDYVGSPWAPGRSYSAYVHVGDGGLSLRNTEAMRTIAGENDPRNMIAREDVFFSLHAALNPNRFTLADSETARSFSVESVYHPEPFGIHRPWECLSTDKVRALLSRIRY